MSARKVDLKYFRPDKIPRDSTIAIVAKRRSGKTTLIRNFVLDIRPQRVIAFVGSEEANKTYAEFIPPLYIYTHWDPEGLQRIFKYQRDNFDGDEKNIITVIVDDFGFDTDVMKSREMKELFQNGRHLGIQVILAVQFLRSVPLVNRGNFDIICVLRENNKNNQRILHEECFSVFNRLSEFRRVLMQATADYGVLVQDNTVTGTSIEDCVMYYKAKTDLPDFMSTHLKGQLVSRQRTKEEFQVRRKRKRKQTKSHSPQNNQHEKPFEVRL